MIPRSWWTLGTLIGISLSAWGLILWSGTAEWPQELGLESATSLHNGSLQQLFSTVMLLLSAQLSFVILWYRSKSRKDFMGRYRIWGWAGLFLGVTCILQATGLHVPLAAMVYERWPLACWRPHTTYWVAPFAIGLVSLFQLLGREMRHCPASRILWHLPFLLGAACGAIELGLERFLPDEHLPLIRAGLVTFWHFSLATTLLIYARFVVHVTREAAPSSPTIATRTWNVIGLSLTRLIPRRSQQAKQTDAAAKPKVKPSPTRQNQAGEDASSGSSWGKRIRKRVLGSTVRIDAAEPTPQPSQSTAARLTPPEKAPAKTPVPPPKRTPSAPASAADYLDDDYDDEEELYSRMNKRERKRLKKMQRSNREQ